MLLYSALSGCTKKQESKEPSFPVSIAKVEVENVPLYLKGVGRLEPFRTIYVRPQVSGILTDVLYEEGSFVHEGDLLMTIDSRLYEANLEIAKANLSTEEADYRLHYDVTKRMANLVSEDYVSEVEYERSLTRLEAAHAKIEKTHGEIKKAEVDLSYTHIYSPINGYIGEKKVHTGNFVMPTENEPLATINQITPLEVEFSVPSCHIDAVRRNQSEKPLVIHARRPCDGETPLVGELDFINNTVNPKTGMVVLKGLIPNKDERGWPGEFVRVHLLLETLHDALVIPTEALVLGQDDDFVYVVDQETLHVEMRKVKKRFEFEKKSVIEKGVKPGEVVVIDGQLNLTPGVKVHVP